VDDFECDTDVSNIMQKQTEPFLASDHFIVLKAEGEALVLGPVIAFIVIVK